VELITIAATRNFVICDFTYVYGHSRDLWTPKTGPPLVKFELHTGARLLKHHRQSEATNLEIPLAIEFVIFGLIISVIIAYGSEWLGFGHIVVASVFPIENRLASR